MADEYWRRISPTQAEAEERAYQVVLRAEMEKLRALHRTPRYRAEAWLNRAGTRIKNFIGGGVILLLTYVVIRHMAPENLPNRTLGSLTVDDLFWIVFAFVIGGAMLKVTSDVMFADPPGPEQLEKQIHAEASVIAVSSRPDDTYELRKKPGWNLDDGRKRSAKAWQRIFVQIHDKAMANGGRITNKEIREICVKEQDLREFVKLIRGWGDNGQSRELVRVERAV